MLVSLRVRGDGEAWCCKDDTDAVKGVFVFLIFLGHARSYVSCPSESWTDAWAGLLGGVLGQLVVVMFLFFSGYGIAEAVKRKGVEYVKNFPRKRILPVLINFDVAVLVFAVLAIVVDRELTFMRFVLSLIGWESLGNSNWYIFAIILCYVIAYIAARTTRCIAIWSFFGVFVMTQVMSFFKEPYWYNTIMAFPIGMVFSDYRDKIDKIGGTKYCCALVSSLAVFLAFYVFRHCDERGLIWSCLSIAFSMVVVLMMHKLRFDSHFLRWAGRNVFPIYIYQRLPMIILSYFGVNARPIIFTSLSLCLTLLIACAYPKFRYVG